jgi:hypothetical protein
MGSATRKIANAFSTSGVIRSTNINNASLNNITTIAGAGDMVLISSQTASASASISFTTGIDSTYKEYQFYFINIHGSVDDTGLVFNFSTDGGSSYNVTKTTTFFTAEHAENGSSASLGYRTGGDLAQSTAFARLDNDFGADNDQCMVGEFHLFNPSSTTYVKHFIHRSQTARHVDFTSDNYTAGYGNTTSAINAIQFKMNSGNIDDGKILMFGVN